MRIVLADCRKAITLGRQNENLATRVQFDLEKWNQLFGVGTVTGIYQRSQDDYPYPVSISLDGVMACWDVTALDTERAGYGKIELQYTVGDVLVKSATFPTYVTGAMGASIEPPDPVPSWVDGILKAAQSAMSSATLSESWAVGGTGTRPGEDANNAKHFSDIAEHAMDGKADVTYVDQQDKKMLAGAKSYVDDQIAAIPESDVSKVYVDSKDREILASAKSYTDSAIASIPEPPKPDVNKAYVDRKDAETLALAKDYADQHGGKVKTVNGNSPDAVGNVEVSIPTKLAQLEGDANHRTVTDAEKEKWNAGGGSGGGAVDSVNGKTGAVVLAASDVGAATPEQLNEAKHTTMVVTALQEGSGGYKADHTSTEIINHSNAGGIVVLRYTDPAGKTIEIRMSGQTTTREAWFYQTFKVPGENKVERVDAYVDYAGNVRVNRETINVATSEELSKQSEQIANDYLPKTELPTAIDTALAQAKESGEFDGAPGTPGKDGEKGEPGNPGKDGAQGPKGDAFTYADFTADQLKALTGPQGPEGPVGATGPEGPHGKKGATGERGPKGDTGPAGAAGKTPVRGVDYWTTADQQTIVNETLAALPTWNGGGSY